MLSETSQESSANGLHPNIEASLEMKEPLTTERPLTADGSESEAQNVKEKQPLPPSSLLQNIKVLEHRFTADLPRDELGRPFFRFCPECGASTEASSYFCGNDGKRLVAIECTQCFTFSPGDASYCFRCGEKLERPEKFVMQEQ